MLSMFICEPDRDLSSLMKLFEKNLLLLWDFNSLSLPGIGDVLLPSDHQCVSIVHCETFGTQDPSLPEPPRGTCVSELSSACLPGLDGPSLAPARARRPSYYERSLRRREWGTKLPFVYLVQVLERLVRVSSRRSLSHTSGFRIPLLL